MPVTTDVRDRDVWPVIAYVISACALLFAMVGTGIGLAALDASKQSSAGAGAPVRVSLTELKIDPAEVEASVGSTIAVANDGGIEHNLAVAGHDLRTPMIAAHGSGTLDISALPAGTYQLLCEVPGHADGGMKADLVVTGDASATPAKSSATTMSASEMDETMAARTKAFPAKTSGKGAQVLAPTMTAGGVKQFDLTTSIVEWEVEPGKVVKGWAYNGQVPGPTIKVDPGDKVRLVLHNELPESTVIHMHGVQIPNALDGVPDITQPPVKPGESFAYEFTAQPTPAVAMYHSHHNAATQVTNGLMGALLVGQLPMPAGVIATQEQVMVLNDAGTIGLSLNGKSFPATEPIAAKTGDAVLLHYMNEGLLSHPMHLHGPAQLVIAKDGFPLAQPYLADTVSVAPGERYSVVVRPADPGIWAWHCHILTHAERADGMFGMVTALIVESR